MQLNKKEMRLIVQMEETIQTVVTLSTSQTRLRKKTLILTMTSLKLMPLSPKPKPRTLKLKEPVLKQALLKLKTTEKKSLATA